MQQSPRIRDKSHETPKRHRTRGPNDNQWGNTKSLTSQRMVQRMKSEDVCKNKYLDDEDNASAEFEFELMSAKKIFSDKNTPKDANKTVNKQLPKPNRKNNKFYEINNAVFIVREQPHFFERKTFFCCTQNVLVRKVLVQLMLHTYTDHLISILIVFNTVLLASRDYRDESDPDYMSEWNDRIDQIDLGLSLVYLLECLAKIAVMGFWQHRAAYLKDGFNRLDFLIVIVSIVNLIPGLNQGYLKILRTARVLRPLRTIKTLRKLRILMHTIVASISGLFNVCLFLTFVFGIFAILGVHSFSGEQYNFCRTTEEMIDNGIDPPYWPINTDANWLCSSDDMCSGYPNYLGNDVVTKCGSVYREYGLDPRVVDKTSDLEIIMYDTINFNNFFMSGLSIIQIMTLEGWADNLINYQDATSSIGASIFFCLVVILGAFISLNLVLAQIMHSFLAEDEKLRQIELKQEEISKEEKSHSESEVEQSAQIQNETFDLTDLTQEEVRAASNCIYSFFYRIIANVFFNFSIYLLIFCNSITLALYTHDQSEEKREVLKNLDYVFTVTFFLEMVCKMIGLGAKLYIKDKFNIFDASIVLLSLVDLILFNFIFKGKSDDDIMVSLIKVLRLLRVVRLARIWRSFRAILQTIQTSMQDISVFMLLFFLYIIIFALLGMELFAYSVFEDADFDGDLVVGKTIIQEARKNERRLLPLFNNFNTIGQAIITLFMLLVGDDWPSIATNHIRASKEEGAFSEIIAYFYFLIVLITGHIALQALLTALLLKNFEQSLDEQQIQIELQHLNDEREQQENRLLYNEADNHTPIEGLKQYCGKLQRSFRLIFTGNKAAMERQMAIEDMKEDGFDDKTNSGKDLSPIINFSLQGDESNQENIKKEIESQDQVDQLFWLIHHDKRLAIQMDVTRQFLIEQIGDLHRQTTLQGRSLWLFTPENIVRKFLAKVVAHKIFSSAIIFFIVVSTVTLAFEGPLDDPYSEKMQILAKIDFVMTLIFIVEAVLKIIVSGFVFNKRQSYLRNSWNQIDFSIVMPSVLSLFLDQKMSFFKVLRLLRVLRPLRLITRVKGLRTVITTLFHALPEIFSLQLVVFFFTYFFAILMTTLFSGKLHKCELEHISGLSRLQKLDLVQTKWDCLNYGGEWLNSDHNFDNTVQSMVVIFIVQSTKRLAAIMCGINYSTGLDTQPEHKENYAYSMLLMTLITLFGILFINMFVGVVIKVYKREQQRLTNNYLLNKEQRMWSVVQSLAYDAKPVPAEQLTMPETKLAQVRWLTARLVKSQTFDYFVMGCILLNTIVLGATTFYQSQEVTEVFRVLNMTFNVIFTIEAALKIFALRSVYFHDAWNLYDLSIVVATNLVLVFKSLNLDVGLDASATTMRALRIGRIVRLVNKAEKIKIIIYTILSSWQSLCSLGLLLLLTLFTFAVIGCQLFGMAKIGAPQSILSVHTNFQTFFGAFLSLIRTVTGDDWDMIMLDLARGHSSTFQCRENETYEQIQENGGVPFACGSPVTSYIYFVLFCIICSYMFVNLFVAVIIEAFLGTAEMFESPVQQYHIEEFTKVWQQYDPLATGFIQLADLNSFIHDLSESEDGSGIIGLKLENDENRQKFISGLKIPTYSKFQQVMFYDCLLQVCHRKIFYHFTEDSLVIEKKTLEVLKHFRTFSLQSQSNKLINSFNKKLRTDRNLSGRIELLHNLQKQGKWVFDKYTQNVDEWCFVLIDHEEDDVFSPLRTLKMQRKIKHTTHHIYSSLKIQRYWREFIQAKLIAATLKEANAMQGEDSSDLIDSQSESGASSLVQTEMNRIREDEDQNFSALVNEELRIREEADINFSAHVNEELRHLETYFKVFKDIPVPEDR